MEFFEPKFVLHQAPCFRFFEREVNLGVRLLSLVRGDLEEVIAVCEAKKKQTNYHRALLSMLNKGMLPDAWNKYVIVMAYNFFKISLRKMLISASKIYT